MFWYQDFSGAGGQNQVFMIKFGFDDQIRARGGNHRLILNWQWYEI
jgi:hypothetical protein